MQSLLWTANRFTRIQQAGDRNHACDPFDSGRAATTEEAVELLNQYDMFATSGRDYHFYITDASGDGRVVEYDCESETREMVATPIVPSRISLDSIRIKSFRIRRMAFTVTEKSGMTKWKLFLTMRKFTTVMLHGRL